ncbi:Transcription factor AP-1 [Amphibalanus amphitrite]|uniref:Transcription factor AP-1 n=1 Tax=Amphibalanus amphitrite TaxID=1232801 RepID=A0A6A4W4V3_AMPAM|nr:transcription factor AP-1-like [Amphibalanus amphitrite]XP_043199663.1 transcription factor AP-1-like [Amphibalanus amphitrite]KAF0302897.1 Transcription factor AP-1 [Amphibalanus amphitrite]
MEVSLYGDQEYADSPRAYMEHVQQLKRRMTLDLEPAKRPRASQLLTSPDLRMLKLGSPELERLIAQQGSLQTPGGPQAVSAVFGRTATEEQEDYARGFADALQNLKQQERAAGGGAPVYTTLESSAAPGRPADVRVKEEPQRVPSAASDSPPPSSPVDMAHQEQIKLERKRLRNRIAATKCRQRKLERIARLEERVQAIRNDNAELAEVVSRLREQVHALKQEVHEHSQQGCQILYPAAPC